MKKNLFVIIALALAVVAFVIYKRTRKVEEPLSAESSKEPEVKKTEPEVNKPKATIIKEPSPILGRPDNIKIAEAKIIALEPEESLTVNIKDVKKKPVM